MTIASAATMASAFVIASSARVGPRTPDQRCDVSAKTSLALHGSPPGPPDAEFSVDVLAKPGRLARIVQRRPRRRLRDLPARPVTVVGFTSLLDDPHRAS